MELFIIGGIVAVIFFLLGMAVTVYLSSHYADNFNVKPNLKDIQNRNKTSIVNFDLNSEEEQWSLNMTDKEYKDYTESKFKGVIDDGDNNS